MAMMKFRGEKHELIGADKLDIQPLSALQEECVSRVMRGKYRF